MMQLRLIGNFSNSKNEKKNDNYHYSLRPSPEVLKSFNLKLGKNDIVYTVQTDLQVIIIFRENKNCKDVYIFGPLTQK
jgi:phosphatidate phosphatase PAH1